MIRLVGTIGLGVQGMQDLGKSYGARAGGRIPNRVGDYAARGAFLVCLLAAGSLWAPTAAVAASDETVAKAAAVNGKSEAKIREILADKTARVHANGAISYADPAPTASSPAPPVAKGPFPYEQTFMLHSRPGSSRVIYLDFDGQTISGTIWNGSYGAPADAYDSAPFSIDGTPATFSDAEQDIIQSVWQRVSEDYAPFNVDVTTQDPGIAAITRSGTADTVYGTRALITDGPQIADQCRCDGVSVLGAFDDPNRHAFYQPALVFPENLSDNAKSIAEVATHEVGHNFSLSHDGQTTGVGYYAGHGAWAPIMGVGNDRPLVQWSKGEYTAANNTEDDLAIIPLHGASLVADEAGNATSTSVDKGTGPSINAAGIITTDADIDMYKVTAAPGPATFTVDPAPISPNLDTQLRVINSAGTVIATDNPPSAMTSFDVASGLGAAISVDLPTSGVYYVAVDGVGDLSPLDTGYSGYASIGRYTLSGTFAQGTAAPTNDAFAAGTTISGSTGTMTGTNVAATREAGEPDHAAIVGGKSVWYKWTAPATGQVAFDTVGSSVDTLLAAYTGTAVNALTVKASNDNGSGLGTQSKITFAVTAGTVYRIAIDGKAGASGPLKLNWSQRPPYDAFAAPRFVSGLTGTFSATTVNATKEAGEPAHAGNAGGKSIWFKWTAPKSGKLTVTTAGSAYDTLLAGYTGTTFGSLVQKAANDNTGSGIQSQISFTVTSGTIYRFAVDGHNGASGAVKFNWSIP